MNDGDAVDFVAKVTGTEPLEVTWSKDGKAITSSDIYSITYDKGTCRLYIPGERRPLGEVTVQGLPICQILKGGFTPVLQFKRVFSHSRKFRKCIH